MKMIPSFMRTGGLLAAGMLAACGAPLEAPPPPVPLPATTPPVGSLASLEGRWVNPDQRQESPVLGLTVTAAGEVNVDPPHGPRQAMTFEAFRDGAIILRARYFTRTDVCVPAGGVPVQRLNCTFSAATARPREGSYVLNRAAPR